MIKCTLKIRVITPFFSFYSSAFTAEFYLKLKAEKFEFQFEGELFQGVLLFLYILHNLSPFLDLQGINQPYILYYTKFT